MYCSNCGTKVDKEDNVCRNCGKKLKKIKSEEVVAKEPEVVVGELLTPNYEEESNGVAVSSLVLGIVSIVLGIISFVISMILYNNIINYNYVSENVYMGSVVVSALVNLLPAVLSFTGLLLGLFCHFRTHKGYKIAGIILNLICLALCVVPTILIIMVK